MVERIVQAGCLIFGLQLTLASSLAFGQSDEPDVKREQRLHFLYRKYNKAPTPPERWEEVLKKTVDPSYQIQKGDTLWDISNTFFGDPGFWPKIWSLNQDIYNPHQILPDGSIQFQPGSISQPPQMGALKEGETKPPGTPEAPLGIAQGPVTPEKESPSGAQIIDIDLDQITIPPPTKPSSKAANIPRSIPNFKFSAQAAEEAAAQVDVRSVAPSFGETPILVTHYVTDEEPTPIGNVVEMETGSFAAGESASVFVKLPTAQPGQRFLVIRTLGKVRSSDVDAKGYVNQVQGQIEIQDQVNPTDGIYRAIVIKSVALIELTDVLVAEEIPYSQPGSGGALGSVATQVMGGQYNPSRKLFGETNVLFLNSGSAQGLTAGMLLPIYRHPDYRVEKSVLRQNPILIGQIQVVRADQNTATAVVTRSSEDIRVGDVTSPVLSR